MDCGWCVWVTGLPGSGKSAVCEKLESLFGERGVRVQVLGSDALREVITPKPSYSVEEREMVYAVLVYIAKLLTNNNVNVIVDATGNLRRYRDRARSEIPKFVEAYLECPLDVCMKREDERQQTRQAPEHIYARALAGRAATVPGLGQPYEPPLRPEIIVDTTRHNLTQTAEKIRDLIFARFKDMRSSSF